MKDPRKQNWIYYIAQPTFLFYASTWNSDSLEIGKIFDIMPLGTWGDMVLQEMGS